ncbi:MAG: MEDS domain-containing protein [Candidatus Bathyarchaeota archaeon]|nr:MAG: MEDS domain-containing protein [Candidatus Bathyarchaeota archaeon]
MSSLERNVEMLIDFGLTGNQARVYLATARLRLATIGQISKVSKVRREDVYRILPKLEKMGLVEKLLGKPSKIRATPVKEALSVLIKHEEDTARKRVSSLKAKTETFLKHFAEAPRLELEEKAHFALLSNRENIMARMLTMMKNAEKEINIVFSRSQIMQFLHAFSEQFKENIRKGIKIRVVSELPDYEDSLPRLIEERVSPGNSLGLRYTDLPSGHYIIADFKEALISTATEGNMAENPCLLTNSDSLVGVFQGDFEKLWHKSTSWRSIETAAVPEKVTRYMEQLGPTNHLIFVYDNPEAKYNVLFNYLKVGLDKGEAGLYVASDEDPSQIREAMKRFGIDVEEYKKTGGLSIIRYEDIYIADEEFSVAHTMNSWDKVYRRALKNGFKGIRVTGETAWFFKRKLIPELIEYERSLSRCLDIPMIVICAYNASDLNKTQDPLNRYSELALAHGTVLFAGLDSKLGRMVIKPL